MTKVSFSTYPYMLGFEDIDRLVERTMKHGNDGYPPYNIEVLDSHQYRISLALAGFTEDDIDITFEGNQLQIRGQQADMQDERVFLHRGIATRQFQRSFVLADGVKIGEAVLENGLLHVYLEREVQESVVQKIQINTK